MFEAHPYRGPARSASPVVTTLLGVTIVVFLVQQVGDRLTGGWFTHLFGLSRPLLLQGALWQPVTYIFLHQGLLHIFLNMLLLVVFGREMESVLGTRRFLGLYLVCGVLAGIGWLAISGAPAGGRWPTCIGASGAVLAVTACFAAIFPHRRVTLLLFFVLPVTLTARTMAIALGLLDLLALFAEEGNVANAAHLAGGIAGYLYGRRIRLGRPMPGAPFRRSPFRRHREPDLRVLGPEDEPPAPEEIDRILDKITRHGIRSLTRREKRLLEKAGGG